MNNDIASGSGDVKVWQGEVTATLRAIQGSMDKQNESLKMHLANCWTTRDSFQCRISKMEEAIQSKDHNDTKAYRIIGIVLTILSLAVALGIIRG